MPLSSHRRRWRVMTLAAGLTACAVAPGHVASPPPAHAPPLPPSEDCLRYLTAATAAIATPPDSTAGALPAAHVYAVEIHEYHMCLARAAMARSVPPPAP